MVKLNSQNKGKLQLKRQSGNSSQSKTKTVDSSRQTPSSEIKEALQDQFGDRIAHIDNLLAFCSQNNCSDLYITIGKKPFINRYGFMYEVPCYKTTQSVWNVWADIAINSEQNKTYIRNKMYDMSYSINVKSDMLDRWIPTNKDLDKATNLRYRVSVGFSLGAKNAVFRMISPELPSFNKLNFNHGVYKTILETTRQRNGIVILAGPTGSGKTTTMAAAINDFTQPLGTMANSTIISLEDPVEYVYDNRVNVNIIQKELGKDFRTFELGIKQSLREHPTFIIVGESRDRETISSLVEASRTGHMVFTSFHASSVADTISRIYNHLVIDNPEVMYDLISQMDMILCQRIKANGAMFVLETQYMVFTDEIIRTINKEIFEGKNINVIIDDLFSREDLINSGILKDWSE